MRDPLLAFSHTYFCTFLYHALSKLLLGPLFILFPSRGRRTQPSTLQQQQHRSISNLIFTSTMMAPSPRPSQGPSTDARLPKENVDPQMGMSERGQFLMETGKCQAELEELVEKDEVLSTERRDKMESAMVPLLSRGFFLMKHKEKQKAVLTPQEYYQGCMVILLARLFELGSKPSSIIASLRSCLSAHSNSSKNGAATTINEGASLFSLVMERSQSHPGLNLEEWSHMLGLVATIQSNVYVVSKRRQLKKKKRKQDTEKHKRLLATTMASKISDDSLDAMWVIPLSYIVGYVVYDSCCTQQQQEGKTLFWSWRDIRPKIDAILDTAFPKLRPNEYVDAGLMLLQLDLLQNDSKSMYEVINTSSVAEDLLNE